MGTEIATLDIFVKGIRRESVFLARLVSPVDGAKVLGGMINGTTAQVERIVKVEQRCITPVGEESAVVERNALTAITLNESVLTVVEEVALVEPHGDRAAQLHDAVCTVMDIGVSQIEVGGLNQVEAVGTTAIEVAVLHHVHTSALDTDDTTRAVATFGMADGEILHLAVVAVDEIEAVGVTGINLDARVLSALDNQATHIDECQLPAIGLTFTDHKRFL